MAAAGQALQLTAAWSGDRGGGYGVVDGLGRMRGLCTLVRQICVVYELCLVFLGRYLRAALLKF